MGKKFKVSRKTKKIILGGCIGAMVILIAGLFIYLYIADTNTLGRKISIYGLDVSTLTVDKAEQKILKLLFRKMVKSYIKRLLEILVMI